MVYADICDKVERGCIDQCHGFGVASGQGGADAKNSLNNGEDASTTFGGPHFEKKVAAFACVTGDLIFENIKLSGSVEAELVELSGLAGYFFPIHTSECAADDWGGVSRARSEEDYVLE